MSGPDPKLIEKKKISEFLEILKKEYKILAPVEKNGDFRFSELRTTNYGPHLFDGYRNTKIPPKEILFAQSETLFEFSNGQITNHESRITNQLIFGIRPCDVRSFSFLDKVFGGKEIEDPYYLERREKTLIISLACNKPQTTCFCTSLKGSPDGEGGIDIILFDLGEEILIKTISSKGEKLIKGMQKLLKEASKSHINKKEELMKASLKKIDSNKLILNGLEEKLDKSFDAPFWNTLHLKCLGCGICTFLCPTCHCFDITDEVVKDKGKRMRYWDSCQFPLFTKHASGHNPRPTYKERMRNRIMHKFNYCPENFKEIFCVGCGRCIRNCPVNLDIREVLKIANG